jgi:hypothetical protein
MGESVMWLGEECTTDLHRLLRIVTDQRDNQGLSEKHPCHFDPDSSGEKSCYEPDKISRHSPLRGFVPRNDKYDLMDILKQITLF